MEKTKIYLEKKEFVEIEIQLPFYAYYQGESEEIFVKITERDFKKITIMMHGAIEIFKTKASNSLAAIWYENKTDWKQWQDAVRQAKAFISTM